MKLRTILFFTLLATIGSIYFKGVSLQSILYIIFYIVFAIRKIGIYVSHGKLVALDAVTAFLTIVFEGMMRILNWKAFLLVVLFRAVYIVLVTYECKSFVYVELERRKED